MRENTHAVLELTLNGGACTDMALAFVNPENATDDPIWIPRSKIRNLDDVLDSLEDGIRWSARDVVTVEIPIWIVEEKGLDGYAEEIDE